MSECFGSQNFSGFGDSAGVLAFRSCSTLIGKVLMKKVKFESYREPQVILFSTLNKTPKHLKPDAKTYWNHLTIAGHQIYEQIHATCTDPKSTSGMVHSKCSPRSTFDCGN